MPEVEQYFTLAPEMVVLAGFDGYWKRVNPTVEALLGYTEREALGRPFMELVHPEDRERSEEAARRVLEGTTIRAFENRMLCKDGSHKWIEWTVTPVPEERVMYGVGRDVTERRRSESEQAALQRIATLVAQEVPQADVFGAIAEEIGRVLGTEEVRMLRFDSDGSAVVVGSLGRPDAFPLGTHLQLDGDSVALRVLRTGRPARFDDYRAATGSFAEAVRSIGVRAVVGVPVFVEGRLWGAITAGSTHDGPLPPDSEARLDEFTKLMATAIANAESREALAVLADEQASLRRVATLVAEGIPSTELFSAVTTEVAHVFSGVDPTLVASVIRFDRGPESVLVGASRPYEREPLGTRWTPKELYVSTRVLRTGRSARIDEADLDTIGGPDAEVLRLRGFLYQVGSPVVVEGELWGAMCLNSRQELPPETDERLESFTELVATAIANAESREAITELADEQAALRRVATLAAGGTGAYELFAAVAGEVHQLLGAEASAIVRFEDDETVVTVGTHGGGYAPGTRTELHPNFVVDSVYRTGRAARFDADDLAAADMPAAIRDMGIRSFVASPIVVEGELWGAIVVGSLRSLPQETEARLGDFTDLVATAVANTQARQDVTALADEQAALRRVATLVARDAPSTDVFEAVATEVGKLLDTDVTVVGRYDGDGAATAIGSWTASGEGVPVGTRSVIGGHNVLTMVAETEKPARVDGYENASGEAAEIARRFGWRSSIAAPIVVEGRLWGVMLVATQRPEPFPAGAEERLALFTDLVATAVANTEARHALERVAAEQAALRRVATLVARGAQPNEVFWAVSDEVGRHFGTELAAVGRFEPDGRTLGFVGAGRTREQWEVADFMASAEVLRTGRSARADAPRWASAEGQTAERLRSLGIVSTVASPIVVEGELWGAMLVASSEALLPVDTEERLEKFTELVATAIANAESREARVVLTEEQAALRRVATLVAQGTSPQDLFDAVAEEVGRLLPAANVSMGRYETDDSVTSIASWSSDGPAFPIGVRWPIKGTNVAWMVLQAGKPARIDDFSDAIDPIGAAVREAGYTSAVGSPIVVEGHLWGVISASAREGPMPPGTEARLTSFTELVATAIANTESRSELAASRRRIVAASDDARRKIERDLHDGTQQRLVSLALNVHAVEATLPSELESVRGELDAIGAGLADAVAELREIARGIHPAILTEGGLGPALRTLARRSGIPIELDVDIDERLAEPIEVAVYFVASEALTNAAKHAQASRVALAVARHDESIVLSIRDDGVGGATPTRGSGLAGLADRVQALGGTIRLTSRPGAGTEITAELPLEPGTADDMPGVAGVSESIPPGSTP